MLIAAWLATSLATWFAAAFPARFAASLTRLVFAQLAMTFARRAIGPATAFPAALSIAIIHPSFAGARAITTVISRFGDILGRKGLPRFAVSLLRIARRTRRLRLIAGLLLWIAGLRLLVRLLRAGWRLFRLIRGVLRAARNPRLGSRLGRTRGQSADRHSG
jgi:hypothetical protein